MHVYTVWIPTNLILCFIEVQCARSAVVSFSCISASFIERLSHWITDWISRGLSCRQVVHALLRNIRVSTLVISNERQLLTSCIAEKWLERETSRRELLHSVIFCTVSLHIEKHFEETGNDCWLIFQIRISCQIRNVNVFTITHRSRKLYLCCRINHGRIASWFRHGSARYLRRKLSMDDYPDSVRIYWPKSISWFILAKVAFIIKAKIRLYEKEIRDRKQIEITWSWLSEA